MALKEAYEEALKALLREAKRFYGPRLVSLVVFGSVGRGAFRPGSDIDVLIIASGLARGRHRRVAEFAQLEKALEAKLHSLRRKGYMMELSPVFKTPEEALAGTPLFLDMLQDARVLYDKGGFFRKVLERLAARLKELGAVRRWRANAWYWDLKPDYRPGEVFCL
jgi:hypothetical protein